VIGRAGPKGSVPAVMRTAFGGQRIIDMLVGEQLPRICCPGKSGILLHAFPDA
jgi:hydrogenase expression/formation protein HypE